MKIIKETSNLMILRDWTIVTLFVGGFFCLLGLYLIFSSGLVKDKPLSSLPAMIPLLVGLFSIFKAKRTMVSLDKNMNKLVLEQKTITNQKKEEHRLDEIKQVELQEKIIYREGKQRHSYNVVLLLNNGQRISLPSSGTVIIMGRQINRDLKTGKKISEFLNVPFKENRSPTLSESLSAVKDVVREEMQKKQQKKENMKRRNFFNKSRNSINNNFSFK